MYYDNVFRPLPGLSRTITLSTSDAADSVAVSFATKVVRLCTDTACWFNLNTAAVKQTTGIYLPANVIEHILVSDGDTIHAIAAGAGKLSVVEMGR